MSSLSNSNLSSNVVVPKSINYPTLAIARRKSANFGAKLDTHIKTLQEWFNGLNEEAQRVFL